MCRRPLPLVGPPRAPGDGAPGRSTHSWDAFTVCPLAHATIKDDVASMEALLEYDYPMDREGHIHPLFIAATAGRRGMVELLLFQGASAAGEGPDGHRALQRAWART